jgi:hypothetical protein
MKKQIKMQDFKSLIKEGVAKLHRKTLLENRIKQINEELEMLEYDENDLPPNSADDFDVNGGDRYNKKQKQIIPFNDEEINKLQQIGAKKQHSNAIFFELIDKYYIYKLSDGSYELYEEFLGWEPEMGGKGYNSIYFKSLDNLIRKIEPEIEKYKEKKGIEAEMEKAQEERRKAQDWEDFQNRGKLPGVTDLGYNIDLSKFKDNKNRFINKKPNTISELRQIIRESIESLDEKVISEITINLHSPERYAELRSVRAGDYVLLIRDPYEVIKDVSDKDVNPRAYYRIKDKNGKVWAIDTENFHERFRGKISKEKFESIISDKRAEEIRRSAELESEIKASRQAKIDAKNKAQIDAENKYRDGNKRVDINFYISKAIKEGIVEENEHHDYKDGDDIFTHTVTYQVFNEGDGDNYMNYTLVFNLEAIIIRNDDNSIHGSIYFEEDSIFSEDENSDINIYMNQYMNKELMVDMNFIGSSDWENCDIDLTNILTADSYKFLEKKCEYITNSVQETVQDYYER